MNRFAGVHASGAIAFFAQCLPGCDPAPADGVTFVAVAADFNPAGKIWNGSAFVDGEPDGAQAARAARARSMRTRMLKDSDWTQGPDSPLAPAKVAEWAAWRQELRDITEQGGFPDSIVWPDIPA